jgi:hypothetical protein
MATKAKTPMFSDYFTATQEAALIKGRDCRNIFTETVDMFFSHQDAHAYIAGQPGVGKTHTVEQFAKKKGIKLLTISGNVKRWAFIKQMAVSVMLLKPKEKLVVYIDDFNHIFNNDELLDMFKIVLDKKYGDRLEYNTSLGAQYASAEDIEKVAIDYFKNLQPDRTGFVIPFNGRVNFIFTMNTPLATKNDVTKFAQDSAPWIKANNKAAIYSRINYYENLIMDKETYWGWIADVVWNETVPELVGATYEQREIMLSWLWNNWNDANETSVRFVIEKMWFFMQRNPAKKAYTTRWDKLKK